jgi:hypothetical protein
LRQQIAHALTNDSNTDLHNVGGHFESARMLLSRLLCKTDAQPLLEFSVPALQGILGRITKLPDGRRYSSAQFDVQPDCADAVFV